MLLRSKFLAAAFLAAGLSFAVGQTIGPAPGGSGGGGGTPGGSNTQLQYNNSGAFGGVTNVTTNGTFLTSAEFSSTGTLTFDNGSSTVDETINRIPAFDGSNTSLALLPSSTATRNWLTVVGTGTAANGSGISLGGTTLGGVAHGTLTYYCNGSPIGGCPDLVFTTPPSSDFAFAWGGSGNEVFINAQGGGLYGIEPACDGCGDLGISGQRWRNGGFTGQVAAAQLSTHATIYSAAGTAIPTCNAGNEGDRVSVSDAMTNTYHTTYASGGTNHMAEYCDGTNWYND